MKGIIWTNLSKSLENPVLAVILLGQSTLKTLI
jgi:hypothetical protein